MARTLTKKQEGFVKDYLETGNGSLAIKKNYDVSTDETARSMASENLTKPNIQAYLESRAEKAAEMVFEISQHGENDSVKLNASKDILDRAGYKPVERSVNLKVDYDMNDAKLKEIHGRLLELRRHTESQGT